MFDGLAEPYRKNQVSHEKRKSVDGEILTPYK
jgi:hypothetical protein